MYPAKSSVSKGPIVNGSQKGAVKIVFIFKLCANAITKNEHSTNKTGFAGLVTAREPLLNGRRAQSAQENRKSRNCAQGCTAPKLSGAKKIIKHTTAQRVKRIHNNSIKFSIFNSMKICFICTANVCRSYLAQELLKDYCLKNGIKDVEVISRGIMAQSYFIVPQKIKDFLGANGIVTAQHTPALVGREDIEESALVLAMTAPQVDVLHDKYPQYISKIHLFLDYTLATPADMPDPISQTGRGFERIALLIKHGVNALGQKIKENKVA